MKRREEPPLCPGGGSRSPPLRPVQLCQWPCLWHHEMASPCPPTQLWPYFQFRDLQMGILIGQRGLARGRHGKEAMMETELRFPHAMKSKSSPGYGQSPETLDTPLTYTHTLRALVAAFPVGAGGVPGVSFVCSATDLPYPPWVVPGTCSQHARGGVPGSAGTCVCGQGCQQHYGIWPS